MSEEGESGGDGESEGNEGEGEAYCMKCLNKLMQLFDVAKRVGFMKERAHCVWDSSTETQGEIGFQSIRASAFFMTMVFDLSLQLSV